MTRSFMPFLLGVVVTALVFSLWLRQYCGYALAYYPVDGHYEVNMMSATPVIGIAKEAPPDVRVLMMGGNKIKVIALINPGTELACVRLIPREEGFSPERFLDDHGQIWTRLEGRDFSPNKPYQGTITTDGTDVYFRESHFTGKKPLGLWKLVSR